MQYLDDVPTSDKEEEDRAADPTKHPELGHRVAAGQDILHIPSQGYLGSYRW